MILNVSGRTDIVAFYSKWFMNRYHEGFVDVRNPFNKHLISRIYFEDVDAIMFCTKNPLPIIPFLKEIDKPIIFHVTLTPYKTDIEVNVIDKKDIIEGIKKISDIVGIDYLFVRYDPIFISDKYNLDYHVKAFTKMCELLNGYVNKIIISFLDDYKNVRANYKYLQYRELMEQDYEVLGKSFSKIARDNNMIVQTCFEENNLTQYGFIKGECLSHELAYILTGKKYKNWRARGKNGCSCVEMVDIGDYNSCKHLCKYCYANYDEMKVNQNVRLHNPDSSLLIGSIKEDDEVKIRRK